MKIYVIGSRPGAELPDAAPDHVYVAQSALPLAQRYKGKCPITAVMGGPLFCSSRTRSESTRLRLKGCYADRMLITYGNQYAPDLHPEDIGIRVDEVIWVSIREKSMRALRTIGVQRLLRASMRFLGPLSIIDLARRYLTGVYPHKLLRISSGGFAVYWALEESQPDVEIQIYGIGLRGGVGHYFDVDRKYPDGHVFADSLLFESIASKPRGRDVWSDDLDVNIALARDMSQVI